MRRSILCSLALVSLTGGQALAHAHLEASAPRAGAVVAHAPPQLRLRFNEVVRRAGTGVELVYPDGHSRLLGALAQDPKDVRAVLAPLPADLSPGRYLVNWRALSPDAHHTKGTFAFTVRP
jgi:hypothetical protein